MYSVFHLFLHYQKLIKEAEIFFLSNLFNFFLKKVTHLPISYSLYLFFDMVPQQKLYHGRPRLPSNTVQNQSLQSYILTSSKDNFPYFAKQIQCFLPRFFCIKYLLFCLEVELVGCIQQPQNISIVLVSGINKHWLGFWNIGIYE